MLIISVVGVVKMHRGCTIIILHEQRPHISISNQLVKSGNILKVVDSIITFSGPKQEHTAYAKIQK